MSGGGGLQLSVISDKEHYPCDENTLLLSIFVSDIESHLKATGI